LSVQPGFFTTCDPIAVDRPHTLGVQHRAFKSFSNGIRDIFDGVNDVWMIYGGPAVAQVRAVKVFNRWGDLVYAANNIPTDSSTFGWDGKFRGRDASSGVYVFYTEVEFIDGVVLDYKGDITIVR